MGVWAWRVWIRVAVSAHVLHEHTRDAAQQLRKDHTGVAPRAHERPMGDRPANLRQVLLGTCGLVELRHHRFDGQGHVRARVPVRNGIDVQPVDRFLVGAQQVEIDAHDRCEVGGTQPPQCLHGRGC